MKALIGVSLLALVGCGSDDADSVFVTTNWTFRSVAANTPIPCPDGFPVAELHVRAPAGRKCNTRGESECITPLACDAGMGTSDALVRGVYEVWLEFTSSDSTSVYATTTSESLDVTLGDKNFARQILTDGGVFRFAFTLHANNGDQRTCEQAGVVGVVINASDEADPSSATGDEVDCEAGVGVSFGLAVGSYAVSLEAVDDFGQTAGLSELLTGQLIVGPSGVTDLGSIRIEL